MDWVILSGPTIAKLTGLGLVSGKRNQAGAKSFFGGLLFAIRAAPTLLVTTPTK
jgi:hypothetical protein